ncbi:hypothetical protein [Microbacterium sp.]|uniref:hypothetical protein n=1 Tax=Microbacterium sp. TaxID=51671 RepID=UPI003A8DC45C
MSGQFARWREAWSVDHELAVLCVDGIQRSITVDHRAAFAFDDGEHAALIVHVSAPEPVPLTFVASAGISSRSVSPTGRPPWRLSSANSGLQAPVCVTPKQRSSANGRVRAWRSASVTLTIHRDDCGGASGCSTTRDASLRRSMRQCT